jgi:L-amino acid N-acyltransferase YncA/ADP-ribose pyrophosphatase YjhB (NUDIX family)
VVIRPATEADAPAIWEIFHAVVAGRDTYTFSPDTPPEEGIGYWLGPGITSFVAEIDAAVVGMYKVIPNRRDLGSHVANASYMVHPRAAGRGAGRAMGVHSLRQARAQGYEAMQFNFVVSTNRRAVALWQSLGFRIVGTLPRSFRHGTLGLVDAYVMHRFLDDIVLTFGSPPADGIAFPRPSVYALIANARGELAVVQAEEGVLLPGGGEEEDESHETAIVREVVEECALAVKVTGSVGEAVQFVHSEKHQAHFEKRSHFVIADIVTATASTPEHRTVWLPPPHALQAVTYESHAWALKRWVRLHS